MRPQQWKWPFSPPLKLTLKLQLLTSQVFFFALWLSYGRNHEASWLPPPPTTASARNGQTAPQLLFWELCLILFLQLLGFLCSDPLWSLSLRCLPRPVYFSPACLLLAFLLIQLRHPYLGLSLTALVFWNIMLETCKNNARGASLLRHRQRISARKAQSKQWKPLRKRLCSCLIHTPSCISY